MISVRAYIVFPCVTEKWLPRFRLRYAYSMRLTETQIQAINATAEEFFCGDARVSLFGSRVDDHLRGGDIDLLIEVYRVLDNRPAMAARFSARLQRRIGEQRIDVLIIDPNTRLQPIHRIARETGVKL